MAMTTELALTSDVWKQATTLDKMQSLSLLAKLPRRATTDPDMVEATYLIALDGVTEYALNKASRKILQGALGHAFMPSPPELRIECDRIMQPHQDLLRLRREHRKRLTWDEDITGQPDKAARDRMTALWQSVRPMFDPPKPKDPAKPRTDEERLAALSKDWPHPDPKLFETIFMTRGID